MVQKIDQDQRRFKQIVRGKIRENLKKYITHGEMIGRQGRELVSIPIPQLDVPHFRYGKNGSGGVGQGEGEDGQPIASGGEQPGGVGAKDERPAGHWELVDDALVAEPPVRVEVVRVAVLEPGEQPEVGKPTDPTCAVPLRNVVALTISFSASPLWAQQSFVNFETPHVTPLALSSDGGTLRELGGEGGHAPETPVVVGGWLLMTMWDRARGKELWRSDGTGEGTRRLRDLNPGPEDSRPRALTRLGERACFMATTGRSPDSRERLWCSDGTAAGTAPVTDQHLGFVRTLRAAIGLLWIESDVNHVATLWRSDGTPGGTFSAGRGGAAIRRVRGEIVLPQKALGAQRGVVAHGWHAGRHDAPACLAHVAYRLRL